MTTATIAKKDRRSIEYEVMTEQTRRRQREDRLRATEMRDPLAGTPSVSRDQIPPVRSFIHDIVSSDVVPSASVVMQNKSGTFTRPRGMYIMVPLLDNHMPLPIDGEWFSSAAYPPQMHRYLLHSYNMNHVPVKIIEESEFFLRQAYNDLSKVGLNIKFGVLNSVFQDLITRPMSQNNAVRNNYLLLAYSMTRLLFENQATLPLRKYESMSFPSVIAASFMNRALGFYDFLLKFLKINVFLDYTVNRPGGRKLNAFDYIPTIATKLAVAATVVKDRIMPTKINEFQYEVIQNIVLNLPKLDEKDRDERVKLPFNAEDPERMSMRIKYYLSLINDHLVGNQSES